MLLMLRFQASTRKINLMGVGEQRNVLCKFLCAIIELRIFGPIDLNISKCVVKFVRSNICVCVWMVRRNQVVAKLNLLYRAWNLRKLGFAVFKDLILNLWSMYSLHYYETWAIWGEVFSLAKMLWVCPKSPIFKL